jgi:hypothetical protein
MVLGIADLKKIVHLHQKVAGSHGTATVTYRGHLISSLFPVIQENSGSIDENPCRDQNFLVSQ